LVSFLPVFDKILSEGNFVYYGLELVYNNVASSGLKENIITDTEEIISSRYPDGGTNFFQSGAYLSYKKNVDKCDSTVN